eukprot:SAG31_NODE_2_length_46263_cov_45.908043_9_plen_144_part_00
MIMACAVAVENENPPGTATGMTEHVSQPKAAHRLTQACRSHEQSNADQTCAIVVWQPSLLSAVHASSSEIALLRAPAGERCCTAADIDGGGGPARTESTGERCCTAADIDGGGGPARIESLKLALSHGTNGSATGGVVSNGRR